MIGAICTCGVSFGRAFPEGVSYTRSNQLCKKLDEMVPSRSMILKQA